MSSNPDFAPDADQSNQLIEVTTSFWRYRCAVWLAKQAIRDGLCASANILPLRAFQYVLHEGGRIHEQTEYRVNLQTAERHRVALLALIDSIHGEDAPFSDAEARHMGSISSEYAHWLQTAGREMVLLDGKKAPENYLPSKLQLTVLRFGQGFENLLDRWLPDAKPKHIVWFTLAFVALVIIGFVIFITSGVAA